MSDWTLEELPEHPSPSTEPQGLVRVIGLVGTPRTLAPADLVGLPQTALTENFACEEGWTVPGQMWSGVLVGDILEDVASENDGLWVEFASGEFAFSAPLADARRALVALSLNGEPLTRAHGGPCRLYLAGEACFTSVKWLDRIEVRREPGPDRAAEIARQRLVVQQG